MPFSEFSRTYGRTIAGVGLTAMAISLSYVGNGVFKRFDEVTSLANDVKTSVAEVKSVVGEVRGVQKVLKDDLGTLRAQFPALGKETGEAAAKGVDAYKKAMDCDEDCTKAQKAVKLLDRVRERK